jgi:DNA-binding MarR family transcriptional regulator
MTKQAMAEPVRYLETHGYVVRVPDPVDRRAELVRPTERGREVVAIAQ